MDKHEFTKRKHDNDKSRQAWSTRRCPECEAVSALQVVVSDREKDAVGLGWFSMFCDLLSTCDLPGISLAVCGGIGPAGASRSARLSLGRLPARIWTLPDVREIMVFIVVVG